MEITVAIPSIPPRREQLHRALQSVFEQDHPASAISIAYDLNKEGAPRTRDRALQAVETEWVAFLDDDDEFMPNHLRRLAIHAEVTGADYVYSWFDVIGGSDPLGHFGKEFDPEHPTQTTVTVLVRTELAKSVGFHSLVEGKTIDGNAWGEDYEFTLGCLRAGALISHVPEITWKWHHWGYGQPGSLGNTSGQSTRW